MKQGGTGKQAWFVPSQVYSVVIVDGATQDRDRKGSGDGRLLGEEAGDGEGDEEEVVAITHSEMRVESRLCILINMSKKSLPDLLDLLLQALVFVYCQVYT